MSPSRVIAISSRRAEVPRRGWSPHTTVGASTTSSMSTRCRGGKITTDCLSMSSSPVFDADCRVTNRQFGHKSRLVSHKITGSCGCQHILSSDRQAPGVEVIQPASPNCDGDFNYLIADQPSQHRESGHPAPRVRPTCTRSPASAAPEVQPSLHQESRGNAHP